MRWKRLLLVAACLLHAQRVRAEDVAAAASRAADSLASVLAASAEKARVRAVAVPPFAASGATADAAARASEAFAARFSSSAKVSVLDGSTLRGILGEHKLQAMMGVVKADDPELVSRNLAQALVSGQVVAEGDRLKIQVKLALVPSGKVLGQTQVMAEAGGRAPPPPTRAAPAPPVETARIEVAMRRVADGLAAGFARLPGNARYRRLAVLPLAEVGERTQKQKLGTIVAAELATDLRRDHGLLLVERERLTQVLGELKLQQMVSPDAAAAARIGQIADAQAIVVGNVAEAGDRYLVTARIVATQTGEALAAESASVPSADLVALASEAVVLRSRGDAAFRSLFVPGLGQVYNRQTAKGLAFAGGVVALAAGAVAFHASGTSAKSKYEKATSPSDATRYFDDAQSSFRTRNWLLVGAGAVWAANVVDAWVSGVDGQAALAGGVAAAPAVVPGGGGIALAMRF